MLTPELLAVLRCPLDPQRQAVLRQDEEHLTCPSCGLRFAIRDGFPNLIAADAELPPGCGRLEDLAAKHQTSTAREKRVELRDARKIEVKNGAPERSLDL